MLVEKIKESKQVPLALIFSGITAGIIYNLIGNTLKNIRETKIFLNYIRGVYSVLGEILKASPDNIKRTLHHTGRYYRGKEDEGKKVLYLPLFNLHMKKLLLKNDFF